MSVNENLQKAKKAKNDEFYTQLSEIEKELNYYSDKFKGKVVFCNCDDPFESNFVKFFLMHFNSFELKALYATGYKISPITNTEVKVKKTPYFLHVTSTSEYLKGDQKDLDSESAKFFIEKEENNVCTELLGDDEYIAGDFRSKESIELLKQSDIVVTNPPFSLFREYLTQLMEYKKQFVIIGNQNAITYKEFFPLIQENRVWIGSQRKCISLYFSVPKTYEVPESARQVCINQFGEDYCNENNMTYMRTACWFTNIDHVNRHITLPLDLGYTYSTHESMYPKYDNYDAINVDKTEQIPCDYMGVMGVPITFLYKYCPEQFEIVGWSRHNDLNMDGGYWLGGKADATVNGNVVYRRILIRRKVVG